MDKPVLRCPHGKYYYSTQKPHMTCVKCYIAYNEAIDFMYDELEDVKQKCIMLQQQVETLKNELYVQSYDDGCMCGQRRY